MEPYDATTPANNFLNYIIIEINSLINKFGWISALKLIGLFN